MKTVFLPVKDLRPVKKLLPLLADSIKGFKTISITSTTQFNHRVNEVSDYLSSKGFKTNKCGPVLGCRALIKEADCTVIITSGLFHAINIGLTTRKPVFILDPLAFNVSRLDDKLITQHLKKQAIRISKVLEAKIIGIMVTTKPGQHKPLIAEKIKKILEQKGYETIAFIGSELSPSQLNDYPVNAWINTACPRIIEDDFEKPIVNWDEIKSYF